MECHKCPAKRVIDAFLQTDSLAVFTSERGVPHRLRDRAVAVRDALGALCLECTKTANDDNPSNHGRTFVSLDSKVVTGRGSASGGGNAEAYDYLMSRRAPDVRPAAQASSRIADSLPEEVEEVLRRQVAEFTSLSPLDLCLVAHLLRGNSLASFARMEWMNALPFDAKTGRPVSISRQAAHARYKEVCAKVPVLAALALSSTASAEATRRNIEEARKAQARQREARAVAEKAAAERAAVREAKETARLAAAAERAERQRARIAERERLAAADRADNAAAVSVVRIPYRHRRHAHADDPNQLTLALF